MARVSQVRSQITREALRSEIARQVQKAADAKPGGPKDGVERSVARGVPKVSAEHATIPTTQTGGNPFSGLARGMLGLPPRLLAAALGMAKDVSPSPDVLGKLALLDGKALKLANGKAGLSARLLASTGKVRQGLMLTLSDGVSAHLTKESKVPRGLVSHVSETIVGEKAEAKAMTAAKSAMFGAKASFPFGMDITAFVQAVLRESYLLQNEILKDYADRVKYLNELKKKIREKTAWARKLDIELEDDDLLEETLMMWDIEEGEWVEWYVEAAESDPSDGSEVVPDPPDPDPDPDNTGSGGGGGGELDSNLPADFPFESQLPEEQSDFLESLILRLDASEDPWKKAVAWMEANSAEMSAIADEVRLLDPADFAKLVKTLFSSDNVPHDISKVRRGLLRAVLIPAMVANGSYAQLAKVREVCGEEVWGELDAATGMLVKRWNTFENERDKATRELPDELAANPEVLAFFTQILAGEDKQEAVALLATQMWEMPPAVAKALLQELSEGNLESVNEDQFKDLFLACDPESLFAGTTVEDWAFLDGASPKATSFIKQWRAASMEQSDSAEGLDQSEAGLQGHDGVDGDDGVGGDDDVGDGLGLDGQTGDGSEPTKDPPPPMKAAVLEQYLEDLDDCLNTVGDDAQLANVDLQNALQRQQQTLQMMSNISKMLHDTAMSIIRKIGS